MFTIVPSSHSTGITPYMVIGFTRSVFVSVHAFSTDFTISVNLMAWQPSIFHLTDWFETMLLPTTSETMLKASTWKKPLLSHACKLKSFSWRLFQVIFLSSSLKNYNNKKITHQWLMLGDAIFASYNCFISFKSFLFSLLPKQ